MDDFGPATKRRKLDEPQDSRRTPSGRLQENVQSPLTSLSRSVTPPLSKRDSLPGRYSSARNSTPDLPEVVPVNTLENVEEGLEQRQAVQYISSPIQLTRIQDLPEASNVDTVSLADILGDPLIRECWQFNYLFDVDFLMSAFDEDVRPLVNVDIVHGFWKREDTRRLSLEESSRRFSNVRLITAHMPEPFGTHHSKMMILFRHDDTAQVVIHTANMVPQDWRNLCQAVWRSPPLPLLPPSARPEQQRQSKPALGTGSRFQLDLLDYIRAYGASRTKSLSDELSKYDFSSVRAALIASVPSNIKQPPESAQNVEAPLWGWPKLQQILRSVPTSPSNARTPPVLVAQVSSIATLGPTDKWLTAFLNVLGSAAPPSPRPKDTPTPQRKPFHRIVFPTADTIRRLLDGYAAGASIHMKTQSAAQMKQLAYMRPLLCHWAGDSASSTPTSSSSSLKAEADAGAEAVPRVREAGRRRAAPHIKTYIRFADSRMRSVDWAMVSSANLSTQAWGGMLGKEGSVRVCSYEIGVVVWPALFVRALLGEEEGGEGEEACRGEFGQRKVTMVPVFGKDGPDGGDVGNGDGDGDGDGDGRADVVVGFRMPYDLALVRYARDDVPWCATASHLQAGLEGRGVAGIGIAVRRPAVGSHR